MVNSRKELSQEIDQARPSSSGGEAKEHRLDPRHSAWAFVKVYCRADTGVTGLMYNVSQEGMFVLSKARVRRNECIDVMVRTGARAADWLCLPAMVVRCESSGFGIMFRSLDSSARNVVEQIIRPTVHAHKKRFGHVPMHEEQGHV